MENLEHITAEWARKTAQSQLGAVVKKQLTSALEKIKEQVGQNKMEANLFFSLEDLTQKELEKRGFKIKRVEGDFRDPRETGYYNVTW